MCGIVWETLPKKNKQLLEEQKEIMQQYVNVLQKRIDLF